MVNGLPNAEDAVSNTMTITRTVTEVSADGVARVEFLDYRDSGMAGEAGNDDPRCFWQADVDEAAARFEADTHLAGSVALSEWRDGRAHTRCLSAEGHKEDQESWRGFLRHLKERGLKGAQLITSDKCLGLVESLGDFFPEAQWQRCIVHFYRNVLKDVSCGKSHDVAAMLKPIHT